MDLQKYMMDIANDRVKQCQRYLKICNLLDDSGKATDFKDKRERIDKITHKLGIELGDNDFGPHLPAIAQGGLLLLPTADTRIGKKVNCIRPLNYIGANSLLFYYLNILMLRVAGMAYNKAIGLLHAEQLKEAMGYSNYIIVALIAILTTFPVVWFINKYLPLLTGKKEAYNKLSRKLNLNINW